MLAEESEDCYSTFKCLLIYGDIRAVLAGFEVSGMMLAGLSAGSWCSLAGSAGLASWLAEACSLSWMFTAASLFS